MPASDQFAPGFEGIVIGLIVVAIALVIFMAFHSLIIKEVIHFYYRLISSFSSMEKAIHDAQESENEDK